MAAAATKRLYCTYCCCQFGWLAGKRFACSWSPIDASTEVVFARSDQWGGLEESSFKHVILKTNKVCKMTNRFNNGLTEFCHCLICLNTDEKFSHRSMYLLQKMYIFLVSFFSWIYLPRGQGASQSILIIFFDTLQSISHSPFTFYWLFPFIFGINGLNWLAGSGSIGLAVCLSVCNSKS